MESNAGRGPIGQPIPSQEHVDLLDDRPQVLFEFEDEPVVERPDFHAMANEAAGLTRSTHSVEETAELAPVTPEAATPVVRESTSTRGRLALGDTRQIREWAVVGFALAVGLLLAPYAWVLIPWVALVLLGHHVREAALAGSLANPFSAPENSPAQRNLVLGLTGLTAVSLFGRPWLVFVAALFAVTTFVHMALRKRGSSTANDALYLVEGLALVPITWLVGYGPQTLLPISVFTIPALVYLCTAVLGAVLVGSWLQRTAEATGSAKDVVSSLRFHAGLVLAALVAGVVEGGGAWLLVPFALVLLGRVVAVRRQFVVATQAGREQAPARLAAVEFLMPLVFVVGLALAIA